MMIIIRLILTFTVLVTCASAQAGTIKVLKAMWGSHVVTAPLGTACDGQIACSFEVSDQNMGDDISIGDETVSAFKLVYSCDRGPKAKWLLASLKAGAADGATLTFQCPIPPMPLAMKTALFARRTSTFRQILSKTETDGANEVVDLGAECSDAINTLTAQGKTLRSEALAKAIKPLRTIKFASGVQDMTFYHYTNSDEMLALFHMPQLNGPAAFAYAQRTNGFEGIFKYLRTKSVDNYNFWRRVLYVAEDPTSSSEYGDHELEFKLDPNARTLLYDTDVWTAALAEISGRYPTVATACKMTLDDSFAANYENVFYSDMLFMIAEDSGVEVIDYGQDEHWFQVLSPAPFRGVRLVK